MRWMIYGANGYTGELIASNARGQGKTPILAGRSEQRIAPLAERLGLEFRCFRLEDEDDIVERLEDIDLVLHCAGPFSATALPMLEACLQSGTHYLDISGELNSHERIHSQAERAKLANVILCPGVGFDVLALDCLAAHIHQRLPDAISLDLGFSGDITLSNGTARTVTEMIIQGGRARRNDQLRQVPLAADTDRIDFGQGPEWAMSLPTADLCSAWHATGIRSITFFAPASRWMILLAKVANYARPVLTSDMAKSAINSMLSKRAPGPDAGERANRPAYIWARARNHAGDKVVSRVHTSNPYSFTVDAALAAVESVAKQPPAPGVYTPSQLCGTDTVTVLPGCGPFVDSDR